MQGWKPESGFLQYGWEGYSEAIVLYVLGARLADASDRRRTATSAWTATYQWENLYGYEFLYAGPLFMHQFSHAWIDFRGIQDRFMREKRCDYFENSRRAIHVQREYARRNPLQFAGYDEDCWGLTACDGPGDESSEMLAKRRPLFGYAARGVPYGPDDGTLAGMGGAGLVAVRARRCAECACAACIGATRRCCPHSVTRAASTRLSPSADGRAWVSAGHFGLDQGIVVLMIENHRTQLIWRLMRDCPFIVTRIAARRIPRRLAVAPSLSSPYRAR